VLLLSGIVSILFGIAALYYYPGLSLTFAVVWTALWLLTAGVLGVYIAIRERSANLSWGWTIAFGLIAIVAGVVAVMYPSITLASLISLIAAFGIVGGSALLIGAGRMQSVGRDMKSAIRSPLRT
jgi:uncharacterized membrane protein HdeD (DUF308 family)